MEMLWFPAQKVPQKAGLIFLFMYVHKVVWAPAT